MIWPFPGNTRITTPWNDPRPLSNPGQHPHGAIDVGTAIGSPIIAPERGKLHSYFAVRNKDGEYWPVHEMSDFPYRNYFYDMFGGLYILQGVSGLTHIFAHIYMNQMYNRDHVNTWKYTEQKFASRFPMFSFLTYPFEVYPGAKIGYTGDAGNSSGSHCHYEVHQGWVWQNWKDRLDPEKMVWEDFK